MIDEQKIEKALEVGLSKIQPSSDLLGRINREADRQERGGAPVRPRLWSRLRLGPKLELVVACVLLIGMLGVAAYLNLGSSPVPASPGSGSVSPQASMPRLNVPELTRMSRAVVIGAVREKSPPAMVKEQEGGRTVERVDYLFAVTESLRGPYSAGQEITLRLSDRGGEGYRFQVGDHVLLFLSDNTGPAGEAYILTAAQGIYDVKGELARPRLSELAEVPLAELKAAVMLVTDSASETPTLKGLPSAGDVTKAYFAGYPGAGEHSLDQSVVANVLRWLKDATVVGGEQEILRSRGTDFYLVMDVRNGQQMLVRLAQDCVTTQTADGTRTSCQHAEGQVSLIPSESESLRLRAPELADWLKGQAAHPAPPPTQGSGITAEKALQLATKLHGPRDHLLVRFDPEFEYESKGDKTVRPTWIVQTLSPSPYVAVFVDAETGDHFRVMQSEAPSPKPEDLGFIGLDTALESGTRGVNTSAVEFGRGDLLQDFRFDHPTKGQTEFAAWRLELVSKAERCLQAIILVDAKTGEVVSVSNPPSGQ